MQTLAQMLESGELERRKRRGDRGTMQEVVVMLLMLCFGELPAGVSRRIAATEVDELERWVFRIILADSLDEAMRAP